MIVRSAEHTNSIKTNFKTGLAFIKIIRMIGSFDIIMSTVNQIGYKKQIVMNQSKTYETNRRFFDGRYQ